MIWSSHWRYQETRKPLENIDGIQPLARVPQEGIVACFQWPDHKTSLLERKVLKELATRNKAPEKGTIPFTLVSAKSLSLPSHFKLPYSQPTSSALTMGNSRKLSLLCSERSKMPGLEVDVLLGGTGFVTLSKELMDTELPVAGRLLPYFASWAIPASSLWCKCTWLAKLQTLSATVLGYAGCRSGGVKVKHDWQCFLLWLSAC